VGCPTVSAGLVGVAAPMEAGTGWVEGQEVEAMIRQDGSNLSRVVEYLCLYRTKSCSLCHTAAPSQVAKVEHLGFLESRLRYRTAEAKT